MADDTWFTSLVCPVSSDRGRQDVVRATALLVALLAIAYVLSRAAWIPVALLVDFVARGAGRRSWSVLGRAAHWLMHRARRTSVMIDLAPKLFAARVGALLALGMIVAHAAAPRVAAALGAVLAAFALLESVGNVCVGCLVYTHVAMPLARARGRR